MLIGVDLSGRQFVSGVQLRQTVAVVLAGINFGVVFALLDNPNPGVTALFVDFAETVEDDDGAGRAEGIGFAVAAFDFDIDDLSTIGSEYSNV